MVNQQVNLWKAVCSMRCLRISLRLRYFCFKMCKTVIIKNELVCQGVDNDLKCLSRRQTFRVFNCLSWMSVFVPWLTCQSSACCERHLYEWNDCLQAVRNTTSHFLLNSSKWFANERIPKIWCLIMTRYNHILDDWGKCQLLTLMPHSYTVDFNLYVSR